MATPFDDWTLEDAKTVAQLSAADREAHASYRAFVAGDHWQAWRGWIGPVPDATDPDAARVREEIQRGFVSRNAIGECVRRHVNGVLGRDVKWSVTVRREMGAGETATGAEQTLIDEATGLLSEWVDARTLNQAYDVACKDLLSVGAVYQRVFVPPGELDERGAVPVADLATSLARIHVMFPVPGEAVLYTDPRTQQKCGVYLYRAERQERPSLQRGDPGEERAELTYLDGDETVVRVLGPDGPVSVDEQADYRYALGRRLFIAALRRDALVSEPVVSQQKLLNLAATMKERNVILAGFLERVAINAQMNGTFETGADGRKSFVPAPLPVGAGALTTLTGYMVESDDGRRTLATPNMLWRDPVAVTTFLDTEDSAYRAILGECNQLHYAMSGDATASGVSRTTAMAAYLIDLLQTKQQVDQAWSWLMETALSLAAVLAGQPGYFDDLRVSAEATVDPGPISVEMMRAAMDLTGGQPLLSVRTAQGWVGVEDADSEAQQMAAEAEESAQRQAVDVAAVQGILDRVRGATATGGEA